MRSHVCWHTDSGKWGSILFEENQQNIIYLNSSLEGNLLYQHFWLNSKCNLFKTNCFCERQDVSQRQNESWGLKCLDVVVMIEEVVMKSILFTDCKCRKGIGIVISAIYFINFIYFDILILVGRSTCYHDIEMWKTFWNMENDILYMLGRRRLI